LTTVGVSQIDGFILAAALYLGTGFGSGLANIPVMALLSHWFLKRFRGRATGMAVTGSGFAIMLAGILVPQVNIAFGPEGWRYGWLGIAALSGFVAFLAWMILRDNPEELDIHAIGETDTEKSPSAPKAAPPEIPNLKRLMIHIGFIYLAFGATYITYATFIVTTLIKEYGFSEAVAGNFWFWVGALSIFSGLVFGSLSDRLGRKWTLVLVFGVQTVAYALAATATGGIALYISIGLFGIAVFSIPAIVSAMMGDYLGPQRAAGGISFITFFFAAGQVVGPASAGIAADMVGSFAPAYGICAVITGLAIIGTLLLKPPTEG